MLENASKPEKRYIARRAQEVSNSKQASIDVQLHQILMQSSEVETELMISQAEEFFNKDKTDKEESKDKIIESLSSSESGTEDSNQSEEDKVESDEEEKKEDDTQ